VRSSYVVSGLPGGRRVRSAALKVGTGDFALAWVIVGAHRRTLVDSISRSAPAAQRWWRDCGP
jgi:hypothetical protein